MNVEGQKTVFLRIRTADGTKSLRLTLRGAPEGREAGRAYSPEQNFFASVVQAEGIRTGILTPMEGGRAPANQATTMMAAPIMGGTLTIRKEEKQEKPPKGISIPAVTENIGIVEEAEGLKELKRLNIKYPLIPREPKQGEPVSAYAHILFDEKTNELVYRVFEPTLDEKMRKLVNDIKEYTQEKIDINFLQVRNRDEAINHLEKIFSKALNFFKVKDEKSKEVLRYYLFRDFVGLEEIEPLLNDRNIEDISCDGAGIPIFVYHRNTNIGSIRTNVVFENKEELDLFVNKVAERCGKVISVAHPLLDAALPDGSRVQATLGSDIARRGSNFTIRMFTEQPLTPVDMIKFGTCDLSTMAFFWFLVEHEISILVCGATASGKTSMLNVLSLFIKPQLKIVSIEDTPELRLPHAHWVPEVARSPIAEEGKVDMFALLRESLRQRPDYIIVGEVRGREAYVLFQQMAVGHAGMSTIHAENFTKLVDRLTSPPISLPSNLMQNLDLIIFIKRIKQERLYKRRVSSVTEIVGFDKNTKLPAKNDVFGWNPKTDSFDIKNDSALLKKIADNTGMTETAIQEEIRKRVKILTWMVNKNITDYRKTAEIFNLFYTAPEFLLQRIGSL